MKMKRGTHFWNKKYKDLSQFEKSVHSQNGEDGIIEAIFEHCGTENKYCVDLGAADGVWCSNVKDLIDKGWSALLIEWNGVLRDKVTYPMLEENYKDNEKVDTLHEFVTMQNVEGILDKYKVPINFDFLNIDIDGADLLVWTGIKKHKPKLVVIECNYEKTRLTDFYFQPNDPKGGAGVGTINKHAESIGYDYLCVHACNAFFIEREFGKKLLI
jgi:hypothetical protein